jgi:hypothetical protein
MLTQAGDNKDGWRHNVHVDHSISRVTDEGNAVHLAVSRQLVHHCALLDYAPARNAAAPLGQQKRA